MPTSSQRLPEPAKGRAIVWLTVLGVYVNAAAYGFEFLVSDHNVLLPLMNSLRDPSLYSSAIRDPSLFQGAVQEHLTPFLMVFWWVVAKLSNYFPTQQILFVAFFLSKLIFFYAVARLVLTAVKSRPLATCIVAVIALSPLLNTTTPFGGSRVLTPFQTHFAFGLSLLVLSGVLLMEGRWWPAVILASVGVYMDALVFLFTLFAFAAFALADWKQNKRRVCGAGLLGMVCTAPWLVLTRQAIEGQFPSDYLQALFTYYPFHYTLRWTPALDLIKGTAILIAAVWIALLARRAGLPSRQRLEILTASYLIPLALGIFFGLVYLNPTMIRLHLLRADSFLLLFAFLLIQVYGANLLTSTEAQFRATTFLLGTSALLFPLSVSFGGMALLVCLLLKTDPQEHFDRWFSKIGGHAIDWFTRIGKANLAATLCGTAALIVFLIVIPRAAQLWDFVKAPSPEEEACVDVQLWMKSHTPVQTGFLVPTVGCGFRSFSERLTWGEWTDGNVMITHPPFADVFLQRMAALGLEPGHPWELARLEENYRGQSWERVHKIARENQLEYIIQFRDVSYAARPVYQNREFAVYRVPQASE